MLRLMVAKSKSLKCLDGRLILSLFFFFVIYWNLTKSKHLLWKSIKDHILSHQANGKHQDVVSVSKRMRLRNGKL